MISLENKLRDACIDAGVEYKNVPADGQWHGANLSDDPRGRGDGRIKVFDDRQGGIVWNHKTGQRQTFFINISSRQSLTPEELKQRAENKERIEAELIKKHDLAAQKAVEIINNSSSAIESHPYLKAKGIKPNGARMGTWVRKYKNDQDEWKTLVVEGSLIIPLYNEHGILRNVQAIFPEKSPELDRQKDFLPGAELKGLFWWLGAKNDVVCICEGFSTAATVYQETGYRVYIAFSSGNLLSVGRLVRERLPKAKIIFCADNDLKNKYNTGIKKANEAACKVRGLVVAPPINGDFNDYAAFLAEGGQ